jgi:hypothetical protein
MDALCRLVEETQREAMEMLAIGAIKDAIDINSNDNMEVDGTSSSIPMTHAKIPQAKAPEAVSARHLAARGVWKQRQESMLTKEGWGGGQTTQASVSEAGGSNSSRNTNIWASPDRRIGSVTPSCTPSSWSGAPAANSPIQAVSLNVNSFLIPL